MCDYITVRHRETFYNGQGFLKYVCLDLSLFCVVFIGYSLPVKLVSHFLQKTILQEHALLFKSEKKEIEKKNPETNIRYRLIKLFVLIKL